jgi:steroid 5-alpha reductase family enzyme
MSLHGYAALILIGWATAAAILFALYLHQRRTGNATLVDAGWALSLVALAAVYAALAPGQVEHRILIATMAGLANLRIAGLVLGRVGQGEDPRYRELRRRWRERGREQLTFAVFYQAQAFVALLLSAPILLAVFNQTEGIEPVEWAGAALWAAAVSLESVADAQLRRFKAEPANKGRTMRNGLWRYSRHPNYFFQWLTWVAYALVALAAPYGWIGFLAPVLILYLILFVTGIPPAEEQAVKSRGDDYRRYQRETSPFVPWFPRSAT